MAKADWLTSMLGTHAVKLRWVEDPGWSNAALIRDGSLQVVSFFQRIVAGSML